MCRGPGPVAGIRVIGVVTLPQQKEVGRVSNSMRILVGVDGSRGSEAALRWALHEAALWTAATGNTDRGFGPVLTALHAWTTDLPPAGVPGAAELANDGPATLAYETLESAIRRTTQPATSVVVRRAVIQDDPVTALTSAAANADLVVVGEHGHGWMHRLTGSISQAVVAHAPTSVVVVRVPKDGGVTESDEVQPVVVGIDGSDRSVGALRWAALAAAVRRVPLRVVHAWGGHNPTYADVMVGGKGLFVGRAEDILDRAVKSTLGDSAELTVESVVSPHSPARALLREAQEAQLLVVGSRGAGGFAGLLLGSVGHQCIQHAACDVAVARNDILIPNDEAEASTHAATTA